MYNCNLTLFFAFLKILNVLSTGYNPGSGTYSSIVPYNILPLTLINSGHSLETPTEIYTWPTEGAKFLSSVTHFSADPQRKQVFLCGKGKYGYTRTNEDDKYCTYPTKFDVLDELHCKHEPELVIRKLKIRVGTAALNDVPCGRRNIGKMYQVGYKICLTNNPIGNESSLSDFFNSKVNVVKQRSIFEIFRFCLESKYKSVLYTEHKIFSPSLLINTSLEKEKKETYPMTYDTMNIFNLSEETISEKIEEVFAVQKLVPSDDFAFALWRKATFLHFNLSPMRKELVELWDYIGDKIRENAIKLNREYYIQTLVTRLPPSQKTESTSQQTQPEKSEQRLQFESAEQQGKKRLLQKKIRVKKSILNSNDIFIWTKIIYHVFGEPQGFDNLEEINGVAIIMANDFNNDPDVVDGLDEICKENLCENFFTEPFEFGKFVRCCSLITNPTLLANNYINISGDIDVDFLKE